MVISTDKLRYMKKYAYFSSWNTSLNEISYINKYLILVGDSSN